MGLPVFIIRYFLLISHIENEPLILIVSPLLSIHDNSMSLPSFLICRYWAAEERVLVPLV